MSIFFFSLLNLSWILVLETFKFLFSLKFLISRYTPQPWMCKSSLWFEQLLAHSYHFDTHDMLIRHPELVKKAEFDLLENHIPNEIGK